MRVHWTNRAKARLRDIQTEIERDRPLVDRDVVEKILRRSWMLGESPNVGHSVRGFETTELLEVLLRPYRNPHKWMLLLYCIIGSYWKKT